MIVFFVLFVLLLASDQLTKLWAVSALENGSLPFIPKILDFCYVENRGIAFGMFQNMHYIIIPVSIIVMGICIFLAVSAYKKGKKLAVLSLVMIVSGALGNIIDKIRLGYVVDFIHTLFMDFPVFNLADTFICIGAGLLAVYILFFDKEEKDDNHK
ncbi:MAG: signal peptidase II [Clostridia bacterium]|nr:signal peptidase II [Clostridia bacterium]